MLRIIREFPLVWFSIGVATACVCVFLLRRTHGLRRLLLQRMATASGIVTILLFVALAVGSFHCFMPSTDGLEADILSIGVASVHGQPIYHSPMSPDYGYSTCYGPLTFLLYGESLVIAGGRFWLLRVMIFAANLLICLGLYKIFRKSLGRWEALALMTFPLGQMMVQIRYAYALRSDIWVMLMVVLGVQATLMESPLSGAILAGLCAGLAIDFKVTVGMAGVILVWMVFRRSGMKLAAVAATVAAGTALLPFALPGDSLIHYLQWLRVVGHQGIVPSMFWMGGAYAAFLILPFVILWLMGLSPLARRPSVWSIMSIVIVMGGVVGAALVSSKPGGGVWHFWQMIPIVCAYLGAAIGASPETSSAKRDQVILLIAWGGMAVGLAFLVRDIWVVRSPQGSAAEVLTAGRQNLEAYVKRYPGRTIQMGYGNTRNSVESLRYLLIERGQPYTLDGSNRLDVFAERFPYKVLEKMDHCTNDVWLIPHGERPFTFTYVFPDALHDTFVRDYAIEQQGAALDAWVCKAR